MPAAYDEPPTTPSPEQTQARVAGIPTRNAVPVLEREINRLEAELARSERDAEHMALSQLSDGRPCGQGFESQRALGNLIVDVLAGRDLVEDSPEHPKDWESLEHAFIQSASIELRALNIAMSVESTTDDLPWDEFTQEDAVRMLCGITRRLEAGAELCKRLRVARWGHPHFGGGEDNARRDREPSAKERAAS